LVGIPWADALRLAVGCIREQFRSNDYPCILGDAGVQIYQDTGTDREKYLEYFAVAQPLAVQYGQKFLVLSQPVEMLEGHASTFGLQGSRVQWSTDYLLVSEWPSAEVARMF
jgi:uncharacterized protein (DUF1330 family)